MSRVVLVNPNVLIQRSDLLTTGIPYMPVGLAGLAGFLRAEGHAVSVVDAFGEAPRRYRRTRDYLIRGLTPEQTAARVPEDAAAVLLYASAAASHEPLAEILGALARARPGVPRVVFENTQAVYAYSLARAADALRAAGATHVMTGEPELAAKAFLERLGRGEAVPEGPLPKAPEPNLDALPLPAWDLLPLQNYWRLGYAHGPVEDRFLPILTSRGCPYPCRFCIVPETTGRRWRGRSPANVTEEMSEHQRRFGVSEFHVEDLNPTIDEGRVLGLCDEILRRGLRVRWKIAAGTKLETISKLDTLDRMAEAGCRYLSFSPETGSPRLMKLINKPFRWDFALEQVRRMDSLGIRTQACFVLGFPGETDEDRAMTWDYVRQLVESGLDEIALFIVTPILGSEIHGEFQAPGDLSKMTFSPSWREDYPKLARFRLRLYGAFLLWKTLRRPGKIARQTLNFLRRRFETKMEMTPYRALREFLESHAC